jgi:hypothetical protein
VCAPAVALLLAACAAGEKESEIRPAVTHAEWTAATSQLLTNGLHLTPSSAALVLPAMSVDDVFVTSQALIGAGEKANHLVDLAGRPAIKARFHDGVSAKALAASVGGPMTTAQAVLRADERVRLLTDEDRLALQGAINSSGDQGVLDLYTAAAAVDVAALGGLKTDEAKKTFATVAGRTDNHRCTGSEALYLVGTAFSVGSQLPGCTTAMVDALWRGEMTKLTAQLENQAIITGLGETQALLALTRIAQARGDTTGLGSARSAFRRFDNAFATGRASDVTAMTADLDTTAKLLGERWQLPDVVLDHLRLVVIGGGDAQTQSLDTRNLGLFLRTARAVGAKLTAPVDWPRDPDVIARIELLLTVDAPDPSKLTAELTTAMRVNPGKDETVLLRGLTVLQASGCEIPGATDLARATAARPLASKGFEIAAQALAIRFMRTCGRGKEVESAGKALLDLERKSLSRAKIEDANQPTLPEAWQAVASVCALDPTALPPPGEMWALYASEAFGFGGARSPQTAYVDLQATFALATMTRAEPDSCVATGILR